MNTDTLGPLPERDAFERWYATSDARWWNTSDAIYGAWCAAAKVERERCANVCLDWAAMNATWPTHVGIAKSCAKAIRGDSA